MVTIGRLSQRFALGSRAAPVELSSRQDQTKNLKMGVGLGGHGRGWVRAASAGRHLSRDQSCKLKNFVIADIVETG